MSRTIHLTHLRVQLALHELRDGGAAGAGHGRPLLLLHGLGEHSPAAVPAWLDGWPGPVHALDFTGHGQSDVPDGGGYTAELLMADADIALAHLGPSTVLGRGLGAYVALLVAGARPSLVRGAVLCDGPGLAGGGTGPSSPSVIAVDPNAMAPPDPFALAELSRDPRPADYGSSFARLVTALSDAPVPLIVCARWRPPWLEAVVGEPGVQETTLAEALRIYAAMA